MTTVYETVAPLDTRSLSDEHRQILEVESGIAPDVLEERGYYTLSQREALQLVQLEVYHAGIMQADGWLAIPIFRPDGTKHGEVLRLDNPRSQKMKYCWPMGNRNALLIHPYSFDLLTDRSIPVFFAEGIKKADAILSAARAEGIPCIVVAINGSYGWRVTVNGGKVASPDFLDIAWDERKVYVIADSDYRTNDSVSQGYNELCAYVSSKTGDHRTFLVVPPPNGVAKQGADDYLAAGNTLESLLGYAVSPKHATENTQIERVPLYIRTGSRIIEEAAAGIPYLISPLLPEASIMMVAGHSGTLKTWHLLDLMLAMACGKPWLDHPTLLMRERPVNTLYVNKEMNGVVLGQRLKMLARHSRYADDEDLLREMLDQRVFTTDEAILDLTSATQRDRLEESIMANNIETVVLDSLSMCWSGDENSNSEVGAFYNQMRQITERTRVVWLIIHHLGKPQGNSQSRHPIQFSIRGAGQLGQQADAALVLSTFNPVNIEDGAKQISIVHAKARTAVEIESFISQFKEQDGLTASLIYSSPLKGAQERSYVSSGKDPVFLDGWIMEQVRKISAMEPTGPGIRAAPLAAQLLAGWEGPTKERPSEMAVKKRFDALLAKGDFTMIDTHPRHGKLYRLSEAFATEPSSEEVPSE